MAVKTLKIDDICANGIKAGCPYCLEKGISEHRLPKQDQIEFCKEWLKEHFMPSEKWRKSRRDSYSVTSYGLKHDVERDSENEKGNKFYVTNGAFIVAALELNFEAKSCSPHNDINALFKIEAKDKTRNRIRGHYLYLHNPDYQHKFSSYRHVIYV